MISYLWIPFDLLQNVRSVLWIETVCLMRTVLLADEEVYSFPDAAVAASLTWTQFGRKTAATR